jgi:phospholipid transport system substrate-binding protein
MLMLVALMIASPLAICEQQELSPEALVRKVTAEVLDAIHSDKALQAGDRERAIALAEQKVLPLIDFRQMTRMAAGRNWRDATPAQRERLTAEFRAMLVRTYAKAIDVYRGQTMRVLPVRMQPGAQEATVRNQYLSPGKAPLPIDYRMAKTAEGWKIVDIVVEGISLALTYRTEFDEEARRSGIDGLIAKLSEKNARR